MKEFKKDLARLLANLLSIFSILRPKQWIPKLQLLSTPISAVIDLEDLPLTLHY